MEVVPVRLKMGPMLEEMDEFGIIHGDELLREAAIVIGELLVTPGCFDRLKNMNVIPELVSGFATEIEGWILTIVWKDNEVQGVLLSEEEHVNLLSSADNDN